MKNNNEIIYQLINEKKIVESEIKAIDFKGYPEIKQLAGKKYIYLRIKRYDHHSSKYFGVYNDEQYKALKDMTNTYKELSRKLRNINTKLIKCNVKVSKLNSKVLLNIDYVRNNMKTIIYGQAIVEGVTATFLDTEEIIDKGSCNNVNFNDTLTILNLKNAWQYILDEVTYKLPFSFDVLTKIAGYVNDRQLNYHDQIRKTPVKIGGSTYIPPLPNKNSIIKNVEQLLKSNKSNVIKTAINLFCYLTKTQVFNNGNKRISLIFANYYLISKGAGYLSIPAELDREFKFLLIDYYEGKNNKIKDFLNNKCLYKLQN